MARVLVIEDEKSIADALGRGLAAAGFAVDIATDGTDGWLNTDTQPYDLVLLDIIATNWIIWDAPFTPRFDLELAHRLQSAERPRRRNVSPAWRSRCRERPIAQHWARRTNHDEATPAHPRGGDPQAARGRAAAG